MLFKLGALNKAIANDDLAQVKDLLARFPQLSAKRRSFECMDVALAKASDEMVFTLSDAGWNLLTTNVSSRTALQEAVHRGRQTIVAQWIERYPMLWSEADRANLLMVAVDKNDCDTLRFLIDSGISNPAHPFPYWENPLLKAQTQRRQDAVQILRAAIAASAGTVQQQAQDEAAPAESVAAPDTPAVQWHLVDDQTIIRVREQREAGYRLTDIFNFALGTCISVQRNLESGSETAVTLDLAQAATTPAVQEAHAQLLRAGGNPPALPANGAVLRKQDKG